MKHVILSARQLEVARLLAAGKTQAEVAIILGIHRRTVDAHVARIRQKTGSTKTSVAVSRARARGFEASTD